MPFFYNVRTRQVESHDDPQRARSEDLMGPYDTQEEASRAFETAAERTKQWDDEDRAEEEWRSGDPERKDWDNNPLND